MIVSSGRDMDGFMGEEDRDSQNGDSDGDEFEMSDDFVVMLDEEILDRVYKGNVFYIVVKRELDNGIL